MSYEAVTPGWLPDGSNDFVDIMGLGGSVTRLIKPNEIVAKMQADQRLVLFSDGGQIHDGKIESEAVVSYGVADYYKAHIFNATFSLPHEAQADLNLDEFISKLDVEGLSYGGPTDNQLGVAMGGFSRYVRILSNKRRDLAYGCDVSATQAGLSNNVMPQGSGKAYGAFVRPHNRDTNDPLDLLNMDIQAYMLGHMAALAAAGVESIDCRNQMYAITPDGQIFQNPDTGEWSHGLKPEVAGTVVPHSAVRVEGQTNQATAGKDTPEPRVTLNDIGGLPHQVAKVRQLIAAFMGSRSIDKWGANVTKSLLMYGPGGCGKSLIAEAIAGELEADTISFNAGDIYGKWVGDSEKAISGILDRVEGVDKPTVVLFEEIDAVFNMDDRSVAGNAVLGIMKERLPKVLQNNPKLIFVATTNNPGKLPNELTRPGRFGFSLAIPKPSDQGRRDIVANLIASSAVRSLSDDQLGTTDFSPISQDIDLELIIKETDGSSGADIAEAFNRVLLHKALEESSGGKPESVNTADLVRFIVEVRNERSSIENA